MRISLKDCLLTISILVAFGANTSFALPILDTSTFNGNTYHLLAQSNWTEAQAEAVALGGNLVTVNDAAENTWLGDTFITGFLNAGYLASQGITFDPVLWIGLNDLATEGVYEWISGQAVTYLNWDIGQPDNGGPGGDEDYVHLAHFSDTEVWNDFIDNGDCCDRAIFGVVEVEAVPEPSTLMLLGLGLFGLGWRRKRAVSSLG